MANEYRISQFAGEALHDGDADARVSIFAAEVLRSTGDVPTSAIVSSFAVEVLRSISLGGRRRQVVN